LNGCSVFFNLKRAGRIHHRQLFSSILHSNCNLDDSACLSNEKLGNKTRLIFDMQPGIFPVKIEIKKCDKPVKTGDLFVINLLFIISRNISGKAGVFEDDKNMNKT